MFSVPFLGTMATGRPAATLGGGVIHGAALPLERRRGQRWSAGGGNLREIRDLKTRRHRWLQALRVPGQRRQERSRRRGEVYGG